MFSGRPEESWRVEVGDDVVLGVLLWLRDVTGLRGSVEPDLPPVDPAVAPHLLVREEAAESWRDIWQRAVEAGGDLGGIWSDPGEEAALDLRGAGAEQLRQVLRERHDELRAWQHVVSERRTSIWRLTRPAGPRRGRRGARGPTLADRVAAHEARLGRRARPFRLRVVELPVAGVQGWWVAPDVVLVAGDLLADEWALGELLDPVIARSV